MATPAAGTAPPAPAPVQVALFYKYVRVPDPEAAAAAQRALCAGLGLTGRVRLAGEGINGLVAGPGPQLGKYRGTMEADPRFAGIQYKLSRAAACPFAGELFCRVAAEITATGDKMQHITPAGVLGGTGGRHLSPAEFHAAVLRCNERQQNQHPDPAPRAESDGGEQPELKRRKQQREVPNAPFAARRSSESSPHHPKKNQYRSSCTVMVLSLVTLPL